MVDSSDTERMAMSREEFHTLLSEEQLATAKILVYANKQVAPCPSGADKSDCPSTFYSSVSVPCQMFSLVFRSTQEPRCQSNRNDMRQ